MMIRFFLLSGLLIGSLFATGQETCPDLEKGNAFYLSGELDSALVSYQKGLLAMDSTTECYALLLSSVPVILMKQNSFTAAETAYKQILSSSINDSINSRGLHNTFGNYRHKACMRMATMFYMNREYDSSLLYLKASLSTYPLITLDGKAFEESSVQITSRIADVCSELNDNEMAVYYIVQKSLDTDIFYRLNGLESFESIDYYEPLKTKLSTIIPEEATWVKFKKGLVRKIKKLKISKSVIHHNFRQASFKYKGYCYQIGISESNLSRKEIVLKLLENPLLH